MKRLMLFFCLVVVGLSVLAETSSAQLLFKRRWQRRKAEIRSEVYGQVYNQVSNELTAKVDSDLAAQMESVKGQLQQAAQEQVASEAEKLTNQVQSELAKLHEEARKLVAAEADKLQQEALARINKLQEEAQAKITKESKRLDGKFAEIQEANQQQIEAAVAKAATTLDRLTEHLSDKVSVEAKKQTTGVEDKVPAEIGADADTAESVSPDASGDHPDPKSAERRADADKAIPLKPVEPVDEEAADDAQGQ